MSNKGIIQVNKDEFFRLEKALETDSREELAEVMRISPPLLSQVLSGRRGAGPAFLAGAARAFGAYFPGPLYIADGKPSETLLPTDEEN